MKNHPFIVSFTFIIIFYFFSNFILYINNIDNIEKISINKINIAHKLITCSALNLKVS